MTDSPLLPVGIDLGSLHARLSIIPSSSSIPIIVTNTQGSRETLALSASESSDQTFIFGDAAHREILRNTTTNTTTTAEAALRKRFVRRLSSLGDSDDEKPEADAASAAFFKHICELACDASDVKSSKLRCVVSVPFRADEKLIRGVLECCDVGLRQLVVEKEGKTRRKQVSKEMLILGVLSDAAAVCVAHGLTDPSKNDEKDGRQKKCLVVDWGASGLSLTAFALRDGLLATLSHSHSPECSGEAILDTLVRHCASAFRQKYRDYRDTDILNHKRTLSKLKTAGREAIKTLSKINTAQLAIDGLYDGMDFRLTLSKPRFDMLCSSLMKLAEGAVRRIVIEAKKNSCDDDNPISQDAAPCYESFDIVLMAGNVCQMPSASKLINGLFPNVDRGNGNLAVEECIAIGCAVHAEACLAAMEAEERLTWDKFAMEVEVPSSPVGIGIVPLKKNGDSSIQESNGNGIVLPLIEIGVPLPVHVSKVFTFDSDVYCVDIVQVLENNSQTSIGRIDDVVEKMEITMELSVEGKLTMAVNGGENVTV